MLPRCGGETQNWAQTNFKSLLAIDSQARVPTLLTPEQKVEKETQKTRMINLRKENEELLVPVRCGIMKSFYG